MSLGVGIVGCGRAGVGLHLPALRKVSTARLVALADTDAARLQVAGSASGAGRLYGDYRRVLDRSDVSIVLVAVPPDDHAEIVRSCLEHGKHVLVEKPLAASPESARQLAEMARVVELKTAVGHNLRCHRLIRGARRCLERGVIGEVEAVHSIWSSDSGMRGELRGRPLMHELGIHHFDLWRFLLDRDWETVAACMPPGDEEEESAAVAGRLEGGIPVTMLLLQRGPVRQIVEILGTKGRIRIDCYRFDGLEIVTSTSPPGSLRERIGSVFRRSVQLATGARPLLRGGDLLDSYRVEWERMVAAVSNDSDVVCSFDDGYQAVAAADAAMRSIKTGTLVSPRETVGESLR